MKTFEVVIADEWFSTNKDLIKVAKELQVLHSALIQTQSPEGYEAYCECHAKMNQLLRAMVGLDKTNVMLCRVDKGLCWILELDYLEDGESPIELVDWPSMKEMQSEGIDSLKGRAITVTRLDDALDESDPAKDFIDGVLDLIEYEGVD